MNWAWSFSSTRSTLWSVIPKKVARNSCIQRSFSAASSFSDAWIWLVAYDLQLSCMSEFFGFKKHSHCSISYADLWMPGKVKDCGPYLPFAYSDFIGLNVDSNTWSDLFLAWLLLNTLLLSLFQKVLCFDSVFPGDVMVGAFLNVSSSPNSLSLNSMLLSSTGTRLLVYSSN